MLSIEQGNEICDMYFKRREIYRDTEDDKTSLLVVLFNYGDHLKFVMCINGEWKGLKKDIEFRNGIPLCPNNHPLMEYGPDKRLALAPELNP